MNASVEGDGGTITPDGATTVTEGNDVTFKITPDKTHKVADVLVNGESVGAVTSYTLKDVKENATVVAKFAPAAYTEENRFNFPTEVNGTAITAEAEHFALKNVGTGEAWPLQVSAADWASNGYFVNAMNSGDQITLHYHAEKPGKYKATVQFRSGDTNNGLTWSEADNKIAAQTEVMKIGAGDQAKATHTQDIEFVVNEAGDGTLVFTAPEKNAPQLDKFDITLVEEKAPVVVNKDALKAAIDAAKEALKEEDKYTEESVKALKDVVAEAEKVMADEKATQEAVDAAVKEVADAVAGVSDGVGLHLHRFHAVDLDAGRHNAFSAVCHWAKSGFSASGLDIHALALALLPQRERAGKGHIDVGVETQRMPHRQAAALEHPLHHPLQVQQGDVGGLILFSNEILTVIKAGTS